MAPESLVAAVHRLGEQIDTLDLVIAAYDNPWRQYGIREGLRSGDRQAGIGRDGLKAAVANEAIGSPVLDVNVAAYSSCVECAGAPQEEGEELAANALASP